MWNFRARSRRELRLRIASALAVGAAALYLLAATMLHPLQRFQDGFIDGLFRETPGSQNIVLVTIDDQELASRGRINTWPRSLHAQAIDRLHAAGARVIVYDMIFADAGPDDDVLAKAISRAGSVVLAAAGSRSGGGMDGKPLTYADFTSPDAGVRSTAVVASGNVLAETDGRVRRIPIDILDDQGHYYPSMALAALYLQFGQAPPESMTGGSDSLSAFGRVMPLEHGRSLRINYAGGVQQFPHLRFADIVDGTFDEQVVRGKIVLVGIDAVGIDRHSAPLLGDAAGMEIHANALDTMLRGRFLHKTSGWIALAAGLFLSVLGSFVMLRWPVGRAALAVVVVGGAYAALAVLFFYQGRIIDGVNPPAALVLSVSVGLIYRVMAERSAQQQTIDLFGRHVSKSVADELVRRADEGSLELGGELREITVLFGDIRGFTTLSLGADPVQLTALLNERFRVIVDSIIRHGGIVNKFVGDAVMAFWNAPQPMPDHAFEACMAALEAIDGLAALGEGDPPIRMGFGIATGVVLAGNVGSMGRFEYTVMGETVNTSSRMSGAAAGSEVWITERTRELIGGRIALDDLPPQQFKGMAEPVTVYRLRRATDGPPTPGRVAVAEVQAAP